jgi:hypothetical protein
MTITGPGNLNRRITQTLYMLKRQYGGTVCIYQMGDATVNHLIGVKNVPKTVTVVNRAIILPVKIAREVVKNISVISANKAFVVGGNFDTGTRMFIVEKKDANNLDLSESDYIMYRDRRYEVKSFEEYEFDAAWVIIGKENKGAVPNQVHLLQADNLVRVAQTAGFVFGP